MSSDLHKAQKALDKAKIQLMSRANTAFIMTVCFSLKHRFVEDIPTACTDGKEVLYNPDFWMQQNANQQLGLLLHETWHVVFDHMNRLKDRDPERWNHAADYVINNMLDNDLIELPEGGLIDHKYDDWSTEAVYDDLPECMQQPAMKDLKPSPGDAAEHKEELDEILVRASVQSKMQDDAPGTIPGEIQVYINGLLNPKLPYKQILRKYFTSLVKSDHTFRRPNRRFLPDHIMPTALTEALGDIAVGVDMSASVSDEETTQYASDTYSILKTCRPKKLRLLQFDTAIRSITDLRSPHDLARVDFTGRGGTLIEPLINWAAENKPSVLVVFSDGHFYNSAPDPGVPVVWIINNNEHYSPPYGRVIHFEVD